MGHDNDDNNYTARNRDGASGRMPDNYDRLMGSLHGLPDGAQTKPSTIRVVPELGVGGVETFIVQTFRQKELGDTIFMEHWSPSGTTRIAIPPKVADCIARQRDALTDTVRSRTAKRVAGERKAAGILPGFMKGKVKK